MEMNQNTQEWLEYRLNGIGASDAPAIMGKSLYKTKLQVWDEKFNKKLDTSEDKEFIFQKGHKIEAWARPGIEFETGLSWRPCLFEHQSFPFIRASLDGWNPDVMEVWECKFMGKELWETMANEELPLAQRIPPQYYDQLCQQMFVSGAKAVRLTGVKEEKVDDVKTNKAYTLRVERTPEIENYINKTLAPALFAFWKSVQDGVRPEAEKQDVLETDSEELKELVTTYGNLKNQEKELKEKAKKETEKILGDIPAQVEKFKSDIEKHPARNHGKMDIQGFKLTEKRGKEIVDYKGALEAFFGWIKTVKGLSPGEIVHSIQGFPEEPSLEKYTTAGKPSFAITIPKTKEEKEKQVVDQGSPVESQTPEPNQFIPEPTEEKRILDWKNPNTGKMPRGWKKKTNEERLKYVKKESKKEPEKFKDIIELLSPKDTHTTEGEQIGGITFES